MLRNVSKHTQNRTLTKNSALQIRKLITGLYLCMDRVLWQFDDISKQICSYFARRKICVMCLGLTQKLMLVLLPCGSTIQRQAELGKLFYALLHLYHGRNKSPLEDSMVPSPECQWAQTPCSNLRWSESSQGVRPSLPDSSFPLAPSRKMETIYEECKKGPKCLLLSITPVVSELSLVIHKQKLVHVTQNV